MSDRRLLQKNTRGGECKKRILFITGTRADFGKLKTLIQKVEESAEFEACIFATGMHMLSRYGSTVNEIFKAGFRNIYSYINQDGSVSSQMDLVLANTIYGLAHYVREFPPDLMVIHGDRIEALAGAIVGALNNVRVAHIEGGEVSGAFDELIRHAVSKLSHLHFVANDTARRRLIQMGEKENSIFVIGSPDIDVMLSDGLPSLDQVKEKYEIDFAKYGILIYHSVTNELSYLRQHIEAVVEALKSSGLKFVVIYPNNDTGVDIIMEALDGLRNNPRFRLVPSMRFEHFLTLLNHAEVIVGNSSAGVREAPVYGLPTINIGTRQMNRFKYPSIINVAEEKEAILHELRHRPKRVRPTMHFGNGQSARLFLQRLRDPKLWENSGHKQFQDLSFWPSLDDRCPASVVEMSGNP